MDRILEMTAFVAVADAQSFSAAAKRLGVSPPTVTRSIAALEARLGARLVSRTTRTVRLTDAGQQFATDARRILVELQHAHESVGGASAAIRGHLNLTAPVLFGEMYMLPVLRDYLGAHPEVTASISLLDRVVNLVEEGLDLALRIGSFDDSSLQSVPLGTVRRMVVAAPDYLLRYGMPQQPSDLLEHRIAQATGANASRDWRFGGAASPIHIRVKPFLTASTLRSTIAAAREGWALTRVLFYQVADALAAGELVPVLEPYEPEPLPVCLVFPPSRWPSAKLTTFVDFARERLCAVMQG